MGNRLGEAGALLDTPGLADSSMSGGAVFPVSMPETQTDTREGYSSCSVHGTRVSEYRLTHKYPRTKFGGEIRTD